MPFTDDYNLEIPSEGAKNTGTSLNANAQKINDGRTHKGTLGEAMTQWEIGSLDTATGKIVKGKADVIGTSYAVGFLTLDGILDDERHFRCSGYVTDSGWALSRGPVYLSDATAGQPSNTPGAVKVFLGLAISSTTIWIIGLLPEELSAGGGAGFWDALIAPSGGDYASVATACSTEAENALMVMFPGTYDESGGAVTMKDGQIIRAFNYNSSSDSGDWATIVDIGSLDFTLDIGCLLEGFVLRFEGQGSPYPSIISSQTCALRNMRLQHTGTTAGWALYFTGSNCILQNIILDGNAYVTQGMEFRGDFCTLENIQMLNMAVRDGTTGEGIRFYGASGCRVDGLYYEEVGTLTNAGNYVISEESTSGPEGNFYSDIIIFDNGTSNNKLNGIHLSYDGSVIDGMYMEGGRTAIDMSGANDCRISKCQIKNVVRCGLYLASNSYRAKISEMTFDNCGDSGDGSSNSMDLVSSDFKVSDVDVVNPPGGSSYAIRVWYTGQIVNCDIAGTSYIRCNDVFFSNVIFVAISMYATSARNRFSNCKYTTLSAVGVYNKFDNTYTPSGDTDPTANEDVADGFEVGDHWNNVTGGNLFVCVDNSTGAAVWIQIYPASVSAHASTHENGGADEIDVTDLSGVLADPQVAEDVSCLARTSSGTQSINDSAWTAVQFAGADQYDTDSIHDPSTNNTRFTIPTGKGGKYLFTGVANFAPDGTGQRGVRFWVNGASIGTGSLTFVPSASIALGFQFTAVLELSAGDYVEMQVYQNSGGALNLNGGTYVTWCQCQKVG